MSVGTPSRADIIYPDSDGEPVAENTLQFDYLSLFKWNVEACLAQLPNVFTAGDLLVYPVEGHPEIRQAPDAMVAFGRPRGYRGSYKVWKEDNIFPQVVVEVWSPGNGDQLRTSKLKFYEQYGAEEYYIIYPDFPATVLGYRRKGDMLIQIESMNGFVSPRLGVRFEASQGEIAFYGPDGREFRRPDEIAIERNQLQSEVERRRIDALEAATRAESESKRADDEKARADALAEKLRALGIDPDAN